MDEFLKELKPVAAGDKIKRVVTARRINAIQGLLAALAEKVTGGASEVIGRVKERLQRRPRFIVWFHAESQRLYVTEGMVGVSVDGSPDSVIRPMEPTLDGTPLRSNPYWSATGKQNATDYEVLCKFNGSQARMVLHKKDDDLDLEDDERAWLLAVVRFKSVGGKKGVESIDPRWSSDIPWVSESLSSGSYGSHDDESDESDDESGDDSDGESEDESDDSDSNSGSSSSSGGGGACCPTIEIESANVMMIGESADDDPSNWPETPALCYNAEGVNEDTLIFVNVSVTGAGAACDPYKGRLWLEVEVSGNKKSVFLGLAMGGEFTTQHLIQAHAGQDVEVNACIKMFGPPVAGAPPITNCCTLTTTITMPDACPP